MICAVHQPGFIPYLGFFHKFKNSDVFIFYDTAQYSKNDFMNRNRIKTPNGPLWLTIPVSTHLGERIYETKITATPWRDKHLRTLEAMYKKTPYFNEIFGIIEKVYREKNDRLVDVTIPILKELCTQFSPQVQIFLASELTLDLNLKSTEALVAMMKRVGADTYLSGPGAKDYLVEDLFVQENIQVVWQDFHHPTYKQLYGEFVPNLSVIDALFHLGTKMVFDIL